MSTQGPLKRFWVFAGSNHYPAGGMNDLRATFETAESAAAYVSNDIHNVEDWWHVIDSLAGKMVQIEFRPIERVENLDPPYSHLTDG